MGRVSAIDSLRLPNVYLRLCRLIRFKPLRRYSILTIVISQRKDIDQSPEEALSFEGEGP